MSRLHKVSGSGQSRRGAVVFVHGLAGDPYATWRHGCDQTSFWPAWLGQDVADVDIYTLEYAAYASAWQGATMALPDRATNVLAEFVAEHLDERPIVFVCHSLGGLVVKQVLRIASDRPDSVEGRILEQTRGVVFIATPNAGSDLATLIDRLRLILLPSTSVADLKAHSPYLRDLNLWYRDHALRNGVATLVFAEGYGVNGVHVVDPTSADPGISCVRPIPIDADHITICKPLNRDETLYKRVRLFLEDQLPRLVEPTLLARPSDSKGEPQGLPSICTLPRRLNDFIGRETELNTIRTALAPGGRAVVSASGSMGGIGKTTLAVEAAYRSAGDFPDGIIFVDLHGYSHGTAPLTSEAAAVKVVLQINPEIKIPERQDHILPLYRQTLVGRRMLLLLDNARDATQVKDLVPPEPAALLMTSRRPIILTTAGTVQQISPGVLPAHGAIDLLRSTVGTGRCTEDELAAIAQRCGYLPLALRAAGAFLWSRPGYGPAEYLAKLASGRARLDALMVPAAAIDVRTVLGTSLAQLEIEHPEMASAWHTLAVFPSSFNRGAAEAVWAVEPALAREWLDALGDCALVGLEPGEIRFRLHDLLHDLAEEKLEPNAKDEAEARHAAHFVTVLLESQRLYLEAGNHLSGLALFDRERVNIEKGQAWSAARVRHRDDAAQLAFEYTDAGSHLLALRLLPRDRLAWQEAAVAACRRLGDEWGEVAALGNLGLAYFRLGELHQAVECYEAQLAGAGRLSDLQNQVHAFSNLGVALRQLGHETRALDCHKQQLLLARILDDSRSEANAFWGIGKVRLVTGWPRTALKYFKRDLALTREIGNRVGEEVALGHIGDAWLAIGYPERAIEPCKQALAIARELGNRRGQSEALDTLGRAWRESGRARLAINCHDEQLAIVRELGNRAKEAHALANMGLAYHVAGEFHTAIDCYMQQLAISREGEDRESEANALGNLSTAWLKLDDLDRAIAYSEQHLAVELQINDPTRMTNALQNNALTHDKRCEKEQAVNSMMAALDLLRQLGDRRAEGARIWLQQRGIEY